MATPLPPIWILLQYLAVRSLFPLKSPQDSEDPPLKLLFPAMCLQIEGLEQPWPK